MIDFNKAIQKYALDCGISIKEATEDAERTIQNTMLVEKVNRNFAESSWIEDVLDTDFSAMKKMEQKAKENRICRKSDVCFQRSDIYRISVRHIRV